MGLILDPYQEVECELSDVLYLIRGLTSREKLKFLPVMMKKDTLSPETINEILMLCLVGWKDGEIKFDTVDKGGNLDRIPFNDYIPLVTKIISLSKLDVEQEKNST